MIRAVSNWLDFWSNFLGTAQKGGQTKSWTKESKRYVMYSYEERLKAIELYIKYNNNSAAVIRELGYPNRYTLSLWLQEYVEGYHTRPIAKSSKAVYKKRNCY